MNKPVRVGMVGAGQLARMTQQAAIDLGIELVVLAKSPEDPAVLAGAKAIFGDDQDVGSLFELAENCDVVTFDHELVPNEAIRALEDSSFRVYPSSQSFMYSQDKLYARMKFKEAGFPIPDFAAVGSDQIGDVNSFAGVTFRPLVLKSRSGGYDGRGVWVVKEVSELRELFSSLAVGKRAGDVAGKVKESFGDRERFLAENAAVEFIVEEYIDIAKEIAILGVRGQNGEFLTYAPIETVQRGGICNELFMPADISPETATRAKELAAKIAEHIEVVGLVAIEMFIDASGEILINELALRPHNSGHATIEAAYTSQFQNHLRAVLDWPLGSVEMKVPWAAMANILGGQGQTDPRTQICQISDFPSASIHLYAKKPVPGRKLGHVTVVGEEKDLLLSKARRCAGILSGE